MQSDDGGERPDEHERKRLVVLGETGLLASGDVPEFDEICERARTHFGIGITLVTLIAREELIANARAGMELDRAPRQGQFCDHTIRSNAVLVVENAAADPRFASNPVVAGPPFIRFYAGAPLIYLRHIRLGALCLLDPKPRTFSLGDRAELASMADEVVGLIMASQFEELVPFPKPPR